MRVASLLTLLVCLELAAATAELPALQDGAICFGKGDVVTSSECVSTDARNAPPDGPFIRHQNGIISIGRSGTEPSRDVRFTLAGDAKRWPTSAAIEISDAKTHWKWGLGKAQVRGSHLLRLSPGEYRLAISAPGHQRLQRALKVAADSPRIELGALVLQVSRMLSGTLVAEKGRPVSGCAAVVNGVSLGFSDARGRISVEIPSPAPDFVVLTHPEFAPRIVPIVAGTDHALGTIQLPRGGTVVFSIDRTNIGRESEITGELLQLVPSRGFRARGTASLRAGESLLRFEGVEPGEYAVRLKGSGRADEMLVPVTVAEGTVTEVPVLIDPVKLHLTVMHGTEPMAHATVRLHNSGSLERRIWTPEIKLDADGEATLDLWQRGPMWVHVTSERIGSTVFSSDRRNIADDEVSVDWDIVVPRQRVQGTVVDTASGEPIAEARVIHDSDRVIGGGRMTDNQGHFSFDALEDGAHSFRVESPAHTPSESVTVTFPGPTEVRNLEFRLRKSNTIPVEVRDASNRPIEGAVVLTDCAGAGPWSGRAFRTDGQGIVALPATAGHHTICVIPLQGSFAVAEIEPPRAAGFPPVQVRVPAASVTLRVVAKTATGVPLARLALLLTHNGRLVPPPVLATLAELQRRPRRTDPRGELLLAAMPAGQYELRPYTMDEEAAAIAADLRSVPPVYTGYIGPGEAVLELVIERKP